MAARHVVVDGSNLATEGRSMPSLAQLDTAVREFLLENPDDMVTVVVDASFGHRIDPSESQVFEEAEAAGELVSPPAGAIGRGDAFLLRIADKTGATVLSNDSFQEFHGDYEWLFERGRLIGGKPVPGVGWIFTPRTPVRGPRSREAVKEAKRKTKGEGESAMPGLDLAAERSRTRGTKGKGKVERAIAVALEEAVAPKDKPGRRRKSGSPPADPVNDPLTFITFIAAHPLGGEVVATVESFASHGAFVDCEGARCYLPLSAMGDPPPKSAREIFSKGEQVRFVVQALDPQRRGVELAMPGFAKIAGAPTEETVAAEIEAHGADDAAALAGAPTAQAAPSVRRSRKKAAPVLAAAPVVEAPSPGPEVTPTETATPVRKATPRRRGTGAPAAPPVPVPQELPELAPVVVTKAQSRRRPSMAPTASSAPEEAMVAEPVVAKKAPARRRGSAAPASPAESEPAVAKKAPSRRRGSAAPASPAESLVAESVPAVAKKAPSRPRGSAAPPALELRAAQSEVATKAPSGGPGVVEVTLPAPEPAVVQKARSRRRGSVIEVVPPAPVAPVPAVAQKGSARRRGSVVEIVPPTKTVSGQAVTNARPARRRGSVVEVAAPVVPEPEVAKKALARHRGSMVVVSPPSLPEAVPEAELQPAVTEPVAQKAPARRRGTTKATAPPPVKTATSTPAPKRVAAPRGRGTPSSEVPDTAAAEPDPTPAGAGPAEFPPARRNPNRKPMSRPGN